MACPRCREEFMIKDVPAPSRRVEDYFFFECKRCGCEFAVKGNTPGYRSRRQARYFLDPADALNKEL